MQETARMIENDRFTGRITWQRVHEGRSHTGVIPVRHPGSSAALRATGFAGFSSDLVQRGSDVVSIREATVGRSLLASRKHPLASNFGVRPRVPGHHRDLRQRRHQHAAVLRRCVQRVTERKRTIPVRLGHPAASRDRRDLRRGCNGDRAEGVRQLRGQYDAALAARWYWTLSLQCLRTLQQDQRRQQAPHEVS